MSLLSSNAFATKEENTAENHNVMWVGEGEGVEKR
jgi:hypothetical protein